VPSGAWQPFGSGVEGEGRTVEAALAVEGVAGQRVGEGSGAGLHSGGLRSSDGEVCCIGGREHTGRRRATWPSGERSARGQEAAGQRPERHVHGWRGVRERQRRRTWPGSGGGVRQRRNRGGREGGRRRGPKCNFREMQGPYCNASITFKSVLKWRWAQKQKCKVFQDLQLCFRVHLQKSNSFEIKIKLSKVFKLYINPI
jgi:hypothetical protein